MIKAYCISGYLTDKSNRKINAVCEKYGYDLTCYNNAEEADGLVADAEVVYTTSPEILCQMKNLKWCHADSAGVNNYIATGLFDDRSIKLTNSSGAFGRAISEHIIMVTLMLMRKMPDYQGIINDRKWKHDLPIRSIADSNIAIIGTGNLGQTAACNFKGLGAGRVIGFSRSGKIKDPFDDVYKMSEFAENIVDTDVVVLCLPDTPETKGIFSEARISEMPASAYLINVGRGVTVDQEALIRALNEGRIAGAALDVATPEPLPADHPLWAARNCIITPHCSGDMGLEYSIDKIFELFSENLKRYAEGEELINLVDPETGY